MGGYIVRLGGKVEEGQCNKMCLIVMKIEMVRLIIRFVRKNFHSVFLIRSILKII